MAERIVSPGVFTQERDLSYVAQGVGEIAGAFIGPTSTGPAFIPTVVRNQIEYGQIFGTPDNKSFLGNTVTQYLANSAQATVVRVLGIGGYSPATHTSAILYATGSSGSFIYGVIHPTVSGSNISYISASGGSTNFDLSISSSLVPGASSTGLSTTSADAAFVGKYLTTGVTGIHNGFLYALFPEAVTAAGTNVTMSAATSSTVLNFQGADYNHASTPWIQSQTLGGQKLNLFKIHTLSDGSATNNSIKVSIVGPKKAQIAGDYGTFGLQVRDINDTDSSINILPGGSWEGLSLDPNSPNYIARVIGNSAPVTDPNTGERYFQGDFINTNPHIRVEMATGIDDLTSDALPFGFSALSAPISASVAKITPPAYLSSSWMDTGVRGKTATATYMNEYYGYIYNRTDLTTNMSYLAPIPANAPTVGAAFSLENLGATELYDSSGAAVSVANFLSTPSITNNLCFTVPLQGGFDGDNPARYINMYDSITATNTQGFDLSTSISSGSVAYKKALDAISNKDIYDINLLVLPGVVYELHPYIATYALRVCESRQDCFYIMDLSSANASVTSVISQAALLDTNYAAAYYPWIKIRDTAGKFGFVPPSAVLPAVYAKNDSDAAEWYAPAGLNRGGVPGAAGVATRLSQVQRDTLYEGKVNPIAQFPGQGICVWGQKTLQRRSSALDRVNVRRLLLSVKKYIASTARYLNFEQNVESTRRRFLNEVNPYLANVQERSGLYAFRVVMDQSNNTPDVIDREMLVGELWLQPTKSAEIIKLGFNILSTGATFPGA